MRPTAVEPVMAPMWEIARPARLSRTPGVSMVGFADRGLTPVGLRLIPHPGSTLALVFGSGSITVADATGQEQRGSLVAGLGFGAAQLLHAENFECLQVRLSPTVARAILGTSVTELAGSVVTLDDLWGAEASRIGEQLSNASSWEDRFALTNALLARRRDGGSPVDPEVRWAWRQIVVSRGQVRIDHLAVDLGWSRKRLWFRFQSQIGLPPKRAARLVRFDHAAHRLVAGHAAARVAADAGYADQSHLHRDVFEFSGATPAILAAEPFLAVDSVAWPTSRTPR